ncbi:MAG TPA: biotin/lipoyl-containing protein, partial [Adhaeribacter sp.]|nr:biotin/lipoyl-containing protein [Adhaeribacter sp.]
MAEIIRMPKMSDTMTEGVISSWLKKVGDTVKSGDILAEVQTDKATMELENYEDGTLLHIGPKEGDAVPVDGILAIVGEEGEDISDLLKEGESGAEKTVAEKEEKPETAAGDKKEPEAETETEKEEPAEEEAEEESEASADVNATVIRMPKMSDTMTEGVIESWQKKVGDKVKSGDVLAEVQTDKATMDLESYEDGTLLYIGVEAGQAAPIDSVLAIIGEEGADYEQLLKGGKKKTAAKTSGKEEASATSKDEVAEENSLKDDKGQKGAEGQSEDKKVPAGKEAETKGATEEGGRVKASPLAKKVAKEKGYNLSEIKGSGDNGRIVLRDVESYKPAAPAPKAEAKTGATPAAAQAGAQPEEIPVSQMRKIIAKRLAESKFSAPHFYLTMEIDMDKAVASRGSLNEISPVKISFNDMVIKAAA